MTFVAIGALRANIVLGVLSSFSNVARKPDLVYGFAVV